MPRNAYSPTYTPYADAAMISVRGIDVTFDTPDDALRFQKGFASWVARQMGYEGLSTQRRHATIRIVNPNGIHSTAVVTDVETGEALALGDNEPPFDPAAIRAATLDDLTSSIPKIPEEGIDLE